MWAVGSVHRGAPVVLLYAWLFSSFSLFLEFESNRSKGFVFV